MKKNTGMNAKDEKAGKIPHLTDKEAKEVNKKLEEEKNAPPPTKTVAMVQEVREKRKNERDSGERILKSH